MPDRTNGSTTILGPPCLRAVFDQDQIVRAVELSLGVDSPEKIELLTDDEASQAYAQEISEVLLAG